MARFVPFVALAALLFASLAHAQVIAPSPTYQPAVQPKCNSGQPGTISVGGRGLAEAPADVAKISFSVSVTDPTAERASAATAEQVTNLTNALTQVNGISASDVSTTSVNFYPQRFYNSSTGVNTLNGYTFSNSLTVTVNNATGDKVSGVLGTALSSASNISISTIAFSLSPSLSYNRTVAARSQAVADAQSTAQQYAKEFGITLGALLTVNEVASSTTSSQPTSPQSATAQPAPAASSTVGNSSAVSVGVVQATATISAVYTICSGASTSS